MPALSTPWSEAMTLTAPVLNAPMGGVAGGALATAVSAAGGMGMIGVGSAGTAALVERESVYPQQAGVPFGIGLLDWAVARDPAKWSARERDLRSDPRLRTELAHGVRRGLPDGPGECRAGRRAAPTSAHRSRGRGLALYRGRGPAGRLGVARIRDTRETTGTAAMDRPWLSGPHWWAQRWVRGWT